MFPTVMRWCWTGVVVALCAVAVACSDGDSRDEDGGTITGITLDRAFNDRTFSSPVKLVQHPSNDDRWYVVEQGGLVKTFLASNATAATTAADIPIAVGSGEQGLLGMAFDPFFGASGEIYLAYTDASDNDLVLQRWLSTNDGLTFTPSTVLLRIPHPGQTNHNGSDIMFGPTDDFLYYSTGDGGGSGDPNRNAQNRGVLLGKILRLDVNATPPAGKTYAIPAGNPHAGNAQCNTGPSAIAACPEIYALGLRNPWRMNFDPATGRLYVGDVGQGAQEEIDRVINGGNFGWDCFEGELEFQNVLACNSETFIEPEAVYNASSAGQNAVTGGAVYRGTAIPGLRGFYIFTDFFRGPFFAFDVTLADGPVQPLSASEVHISAFGQGRDGEVYAVDLDGPIWKIVPSPG
jgi:glucose/arabinose dehydrogenase